MTPQQQGCSYWGKGRHPFNKRSLSCRSDEPAPPQRRLDFLGWTFQPVWAVLRQSCEQQVRAIASILYNTNIRRSMTTVWFGIQISPVKAWRSHGKHDSRLYTSSWFRQKKTTAELVTMLASLNDLGDQDRCLTQSMTTSQFPNKLK